MIYYAPVSLLSFSFFSVSWLVRLLQIILVLKCDNLLFSYLIAHNYNQQIYRHCQMTLDSKLHCIIAIDTNDSCKLFKTLALCLMPDSNVEELILWE